MKHILLVTLCLVALFVLLATEVQPVLAGPANPPRKSYADPSRWRGAAARRIVRSNREGWSKGIFKW